MKDKRTYTHLKEHGEDMSHENESKVDPKEDRGPGDLSLLVELHKKEIWDMLYDMSEDQGFSIPFLISDFNGARDVSDEDTFKNLLVWWAVTQKARELEQD